MFKSSPCAPSIGELRFDVPGNLCWGRTGVKAFNNMLTRDGDWSEGVGMNWFRIWTCRRASEIVIFTQVFKVLTWKPFCEGFLFLRDRLWIDNLRWSRGFYYLVDLRRLQKIFWSRTCLYWGLFGDSWIQYVNLILTRNLNEVNNHHNNNQRVLRLLSFEMFRKDACLIRCFTTRTRIVKYGNEEPN